MAVDRFQLRFFTPERLLHVSNRWSALAGEEEFEIELGSLFDWCTAHLASRPGEGYALELYNVTQDKTDAILDVNQGKWGTMTKLLKMHVSPEFWPVDDVTEQIVNVHAGAYAAFIVGGLSEEDVKEVKIYGRSQAALRTLTALEKIWGTRDTGSVATMQGRWLTITRS